MHRFYLTVNDYQSQKLNDKEQPTSNDSNQPKSPHLKSLPGNSPRFNNKGQNNLSPHTIRRNISKENFMKYQWAWTL